MKQFLKYTLASLIGTLLSFLVVFFILSGIIASIASFTAKDKTEVKDKSVLQIKLDKPIPERTPVNPFASFNFNGLDEFNVLGLNDVRKQIERAKTDDRIKGIYLDVTIIPSSMATIEAVRNSLKDFKESGKFIIAYSDVLSQKAYYLASLADEIYISPSGMMDLRGMTMHVMFFKGLLEKLDVEMQVIRYGKFKSAVEPFIRDEMSEANEEQSRQYIEGIWGHLLKAVKEERGVEIDKLNNIADSLLLRIPEDAVAHGLVDGIIYKDELFDTIRERAEIREDSTPEFISLYKYYDSAPNKNNLSVDEKPGIAVVYAVGEIRSGEGDDDQVMGSERISRAIRKARRDSTIKAIVLRVNSPGGSGLASDIIWREVVLARKAKPVIVSMGDLAASGGYYIACPADRIFAQPTTLTGSIGVFGLLPNVQGLLNNKLGITIDGVKTNDHADFAHPYRPLSDFERDVLQENVNIFYMDFVEKVADGRNMSITQVKEIGEGRIWNGMDALKIGLIDEFGGMDDAIAAAATMAEVEDYDIVELPKLDDPFKKLFGSFGSSMRTRILRNELGTTYRYFEILKNTGEMEQIQARLPFIYEIH
ncbi:MAG: signal peptide peptidase SppA [Bacteroidales bacterium]